MSTATPPATVPGLPGRPRRPRDPFEFGWRWKTVRTAQGTHLVQVPLTTLDLLHPEEGDCIVQVDYHSRDCAYLGAVFSRLAGREPGRYCFIDHRVDWEVEGVRAHAPDFALFDNVPADRDPGAGTVYPRLGARPVLVLEVTSESSRVNDLMHKTNHYWRVGIPFYYIVDRAVVDGGDVVFPIGYRWTETGYIHLEPDPLGRVWIETFRVWLASDGDRVCLLDEQGNRFPDYTEAVDEAHRAQEEARKAQEEARKSQDEALRAQEEARKSQDEAHRAQEGARAEAERALNAERANRSLADRLAALEAELRSLRGEG